MVPPQLRRTLRAEPSAPNPVVQGAFPQNGGAIDAHKPVPARPAHIPAQVRQVSLEPPLGSWHRIPVGPEHEENHNQRSHVGVLSMEVVGVPLSHTLTGWDEPHHPKPCDCWSQSPCQGMSSSQGASRRPSGMSGAGRLGASRRPLVLLVSGSLGFCLSPMIRGSEVFTVNPPGWGRDTSGHPSGTVACKPPVPCVNFGTSLDDQTIPKHQVM